ncbi:MAG: hypothetical protein IPL46_10440 [Saprospiraceae bacterium]|nr:hypothetical protein [Saprospiraceae bacterium]
MKTNLLLALILLVGLADKVSAKISYLALEQSYFSCTWNAWFDYPNKHNFTSGEDVYVRVKTQKYQDISFIELYCNNTYIRKESTQPYEWCNNNSSGDQYLRNLGPGNYTLKAKIKDRCGSYHYITYDIVVTGSNNNYCQFGNPLNDLYWLKQIKQSHPNYKICEYKKNGKTYFQAFQCGITHFGIKWYDCEGNFICEHLNTTPPCGVVSGAQFKKCWYDPCGVNSGNNPGCIWNSEIQHQFASLGSSKMYVKVEPQRYQDIVYIDLYLDNHYIRRENTYPYEWGKFNSSGDQALKSLIPGNHMLKAKVKDKCGQVHEITKQVFVPISL